MNFANFRTIYIECFHSRGQYLHEFIGTKESVCIKKELNSNRISFMGHQYGRRFIVLGHQWPRWRHVKTLYTEHKGDWLP